MTVILNEYDVAGVVFLVLVFGLIRLMSWASKD